jgi:hypothetical protein
MGKFQATEGIDSKGDTLITGSLSVTGNSTLPTIIGSTRLTGATYLSGSTFLGPSAATYMSQTDWDNLAGTVLGTTTGGRIGFMYPFNIFSGGRRIYLGAGNQVIGSTSGLGWDRLNGGLWEFYINSTSTTIDIDTTTLAATGMNFANFTFITTQQNPVNLRTRAVWASGNAWTTRWTGTVSTTNYAYDNQVTMTSNVYASDKYPDHTGITHVIVDSSDRRITMHSTNWS